LRAIGTPCGFARLSAPTLRPKDLDTILPPDPSEPIERDFGPFVCAPARVAFFTLRVARCRGAAFTTIIYRVSMDSAMRFDWHN
jgi:hypothetical protein